MEFNYKWATFYLFLFPNLCSGEIKLIHSFIRHADRNPFAGEIIAMFYPRNPNLNETWLPDGPEQLNKIGKINGFKLGQFLREKYGDLVGKNYTNATIYLRSADMKRATDTAQLVVSGLFSPVNSSWHETMPLIPVDIKVIEQSEDTLFFAFGICEHYMNDRAESMKQVNRLLSALPEVQTFYDYLSIHTGVEYKNCSQAWVLFHFLFAEASAGFQLESWTNEIFPNGRLKDLANVAYVYQTFTMRMKRLIGGIHIKEFLDNVDRFMNHTEKRKVFFYTGNELQLAGMLNALGVFDYNFLEYTSYLTFELHEIENDFHVKVVFKNGKTPVELIIPGCNVTQVNGGIRTLCPLSTFRNVLKDVIPDDFEKDCGSKSAFQWFI